LSSGTVTQRLSTATIAYAASMAPVGPPMSVRTQPGCLG